VSAFVGRNLGIRTYAPVFAEMRRFTEQRTSASRDEVWYLEHLPVFTLGLKTDRGHLHATAEVPVVQTDRGGQVTYHGPGQLVVYVLLDLRRLKLSVRGLVDALEGAVIDTVRGYGVEAHSRRDAPGVYVGARKLAALGLRVRRHCCYHGVAINVAMDLEPFRRIDPCGFEALEVTQLSDLCGVDDLHRLRADLEPHLAERLGYPRSSEGLPDAQAMSG
jgi:lipoyl(octanoyl) transferase